MAVSLQVNSGFQLKDLFPDGVLQAGCPSRIVIDHVTSKRGVLVLVAGTRSR